MFQRYLFRHCIHSLGQFIIRNEDTAGRVRTARVWQDPCDTRMGYFIRAMAWKCLCCLVQALLYHTLLFGSRRNLHRILPFDMPLWCFFTGRLIRLVVQLWGCEFYVAFTTNWFTSGKGLGGRIVNTLCIWVFTMIVHGSLRHVMPMKYVLLMPLAFSCRAKMLHHLLTLTRQKTPSTWWLFAWSTPGAHLPQLMDGCFCIGHLIVTIGIELKHAIISTITDLLLLKLWVRWPLFVLWWLLLLLQLLMLLQLLGHTGARGANNFVECRWNLLLLLLLILMLRCGTDGGVRRAGNELRVTHF